MKPTGREDAPAPVIDEAWIMPRLETAMRAVDGRSAP
jgi:hypothetical protein